MINRISLFVGIASILLATTISILAIWNVVEDDDLVWRALATLGVVFLAVVLTVIINGLVAPDERASHDRGA